MANILMAAGVGGVLGIIVGQDNTTLAVLVAAAAGAIGYRLLARYLPD